MAIGDETLKDRAPNLLEQIVQATLEKLAAKPHTKAVLALREDALDCERQLDLWRTSRPNEDARTAMRVRILALSAKVDGL